MVVVHMETAANDNNAVSTVADSASNVYTMSVWNRKEYGFSSNVYMRSEVWTAIAETAATPTVSVTVTEAAFINVVLAELGFAGMTPAYDSANGNSYNAGTGSLIGGVLSMVDELR